MDEPRIPDEGNTPLYLLRHELVDVLQLALQVKQVQRSLRDLSTGLTCSLSRLDVLPRVG